MTERDLPAFRELLEDLYHSGLQRTPRRDKFEHVLATYFRALQSYPWPAMQAAHEHLQRTATSWPPVAAWVGALRSDVATGLPVMTGAQARAADDADRAFFEGACCVCSACTEAHVTHLPLRYVPCLDANGDVMPMKHPARSRPVLLGEWIHGYRLKRWYAARAEFYTKLEATKPKAMPAALVPTEPEEAA